METKMSPAEFIVQIRKLARDLMNIPEPTSEVMEEHPEIANLNQSLSNIGCDITELIYSAAEQPWAKITKFEIEKE